MAQTRSQREWYQRNRERLKAKSIERYRLNRDEIRAQRKIYRETHKDEIAARDKAWYHRTKVERRDIRREHGRKAAIKHRAKILAYGIEYRRKNREAIRQRLRDYKRANRDKVNAYARKYKRSSPQLIILTSTRRSIARVLRTRSPGGRAIKLLGVASMDDYRMYLESRFELGMSWENYGNGSDKWNIDHIVPLFKFDLTDPKQLRRAFHFTNTRPMWQKENGTNGAIARWRKEAV